MKPIVMGAETEYATSFDGHSAESSEHVAAALFDAIARTEPHLRSVHGSRVYTPNGGCWYLDVGHVEYATPECASPDELVKYVLAGDVILGRAADLVSKNHGNRVIVSRGNICYPSGGEGPTTFGSHESYCSVQSARRLAQELAPFLASRIIYCGSGGFDPYKTRRIGFSLSPRAAFINEVAEDESTHSRSLVHLRDESHAQSYHRVHLICGDSLGSELALYLRAGATALVIRLLESRHFALPAGIRPADVLQAYHTFAADPSVTATTPTVSREVPVSALDIQFSYLSAIEDACSRPDHEFPAWAPQLVQTWRQCLENMRLHGPKFFATSLDWAIKANLYASFAADAAYNWPDIAEGNATFTVAHSTPAPGAVRGSAEYARLKYQLFETEMRYLEVGEGGIHANLDKGGVLQHRILADPDAPVCGTRYPPQTTRAKIRGEFVASHAGSDKWACDWTRIVERSSSKAMMITDPYATSGQWHVQEEAPVQEDNWYLVRSSALDHYRAGRYVTARRLYDRMLAHNIEMPSTLTHLARIDMMVNDYPAAAVHSGEAWNRRREAEDYVTGRALWFMIATSLLKASTRPVDKLVGILRACDIDDMRMDWTIAPMIEHLAGQLPEEEHRFLATLGKVLSGQAQVTALNAFALWRDNGGASDEDEEMMEMEIHDPFADEMPAPGRF